MDISNITNSSVYASSSVLENGESETFINEAASTLNNSYASSSIENQNVQASVSSSSISSSSDGWSTLTDGRLTFGEKDGGRWTESGVGTGQMIYTSADGWTYDESSKSWSKTDQQNSHVAFIMNDNGLFSFNDETNAWSFFDSDTSQWENLSSAAINGN